MIEALIGLPDLDPTIPVHLCHQTQNRVAIAAPFTAILYHGSDRTFDRFDIRRSPGGFYFEPTAHHGHGSVLYTCQVEFKKLMITTDRRSVQHSTQDRRLRMQAEGYDGMLWEDAGCVLEVVAYSGRQVSILERSGRRA